MERKVASVWIIVSSAPYEGYNLPVGAYTSRRKAERAMKVWNLADPPRGYGDDRDIERIQLDAKPNI